MKKKDSNSSSSHLKFFLIMGSVFSCFGISLFNKNDNSCARAITNEPPCMGLVVKESRSDEMRKFKIKLLKQSSVIQCGNRQSSQLPSDSNKQSDQSQSSYSTQAKPRALTGSNVSHHNTPNDGDENNPPNRNKSLQRSHQLDYVEEQTFQDLNPTQDRESQTDTLLDNDYIIYLQAQIESLTHELNRVNNQLTIANTELNRTNREHNVQIERLIQAHNNNIQQIHEALLTENTNRSTNLITQIETLNNQIQSLIQVNTERFERINQDHRTSVVEIAQREEIYNQRVERFQQTYREELRQLIQREREILSAGREPTVIINTVTGPSANQTPTGFQAQIPNFTINAPNAIATATANPLTTLLNQSESRSESQTQTESQIEIESQQNQNPEERNTFWSQIRAFLLGMATATAGLTLRDYLRLRRRSRTGFRVPKPRIKFD